MSKQKRLGRGLDALLVSRQRSDPKPDKAATMEVPIADLRPGRYQPRRHVAGQNLEELSDSIKQQGVLQPLVVRAVDSPGNFEIVAGERRWRAARLAGLATVPVVVRELDDQSALAVALIENLQREDLSPIDQATSLARLAAEFELTHEQVAEAVGRSRASVTNLLRLLDLQDEVKQLLSEGVLDMGHARALLPLDRVRQLAMARKASDKGWSVRQVETAVRDAVARADAPSDAKPIVDLQTRWLQRQIASESGQKLSIRPAKQGGFNISIGFSDLHQLQEALQRIQQLIAGVHDTAGPRVRDISSARREEGGSASGS